MIICVKTECMCIGGKDDEKRRMDNNEKEEDGEGGGKEGKAFMLMQFMYNAYSIGVFVMYSIYICIYFIDIIGLQGR